MECRCCNVKKAAFSLGRVIISTSAPNISARSACNAARQRGVRASCLVTGIIDGLSSEPRPPFLGQSIRRLRQHRAALVLQGLLNIAVFGPVARGEEQPGNDADLLVKVAGDRKSVV